MFRRRRPLARAAMVGGTAYVAGKHVQQGREREAEQEARIQELEAQQAAPPPAAAAAPGGVSSDAIEQLKQLAQLKDQGVLTQEEFDIQKRRLLGTA
jgi:BMFP domain-containing protein YqiC